MMSSSDILATFKQMRASFEAALKRHGLDAAPQERQDALWLFYGEGYCDALQMPPGRLPTEQGGTS